MEHFPIIKETFPLLSGKLSTFLKISMKIGYQLKKKREELGLSVPELAELLEISNAAKMYKWEKGSNPSDFDDMKKVDDFIKHGLENIPVTKIERVKPGKARAIITTKTDEILAYQKVILSTVAEILAHALGEPAGVLKDNLIQRVNKERGQTSDK